MRQVDGSRWRDVDLFAAGVPCPPFSIAGKQLGTDDERDLFPEAIRIIGEMKPKAVMLENVPGFATAKFSSYRDKLRMRLLELGYESDWRVLQAADYGVPQLRPRFILVALPEKEGHPRLTVRMVARIQGFPDFWKFSGRKTAAYRQVGNAFPPPVASAVGLAIASAFEGKYPAQGSKP